MMTFYFLSGIVCAFCSTLYYEGFAKKLVAATLTFSFVYGIGIVLSILEKYS